MDGNGWQRMTLGDANRMESMFASQGQRSRGSILLEAFTHTHPPNVSSFSISLLSGGCVSAYASIKENAAADTKSSQLTALMHGHHKLKERNKRTSLAMHEQSMMTLCASRDYSHILVDHE